VPKQALLIEREWLHHPKYASLAPLANHHEGWEARILYSSLLRFRAVSERTESSEGFPNRLSSD
jgi:hypothetical protein